MKFSVITPSFNQGRFIERTILSVLRQCSEDVEIEYIVCDGGSDDDTVEILKRYSAQLNWISEPDDGQADAVNKGMERTTGDIIAWINSDDIYYPEAFRSVEKIFQENPDIMVVYGNADHIDTEDCVIESYPTEPWNYHRLFKKCFLCQPSVFFRRELINRYGALDKTLKYCMDYELWLRYGQHTDFYYFPRKLAGSRMYSSNKTIAHRESVHYEINEMFKSRFGSVPEKWIFGYARAKTEEAMRFDRADPTNNRRIANAMVKASIWSFWNWRKLPSPIGLAVLIFWFVTAHTRSMRFRAD